MARRLLQLGLALGGLVSTSAAVFVTRCPGLFTADPAVVTEMAKVAPLLALTLTLTLTLTPPLTPTLTPTRTITLTLAHRADELLPEGVAVVAAALAHDEEEEQHEECAWLGLG